MKKKRLFLLATLGYPGSGKTHFSERFSKESDFFHLNSDIVRLTLFPKPKYDPPESAIVFRMMDFLAGAFLNAGVSVIYDANSTKIAYRERLRRIAKKNGAQYLLLRFMTPLPVALARIKKRRALRSELKKRYYRPIDDGVLFEIRAEMEEPKKESFLVIDGTKPYKETAKLVSGRLRKR